MQEAATKSNNLTSGEEHLGTGGALRVWVGVGGGGGEALGVCFRVSQCDDGVCMYANRMVYRATPGCVQEGVSKGH